MIIVQNGEIFKIDVEQFDSKDQDMDGISNVSIPRYDFEFQFFKIFYLFPSLLN